MPVSEVVVSKLVVQHCIREEAGEASWHIDNKGRPIVAASGQYVSDGQAPSFISKDSRSWLVILVVK